MGQDFHEMGRNGMEYGTNLHEMKSRPCETGRLIPVPQSAYKCHFMVAKAGQSDQLDGRETN